jgi:exosome complex component CSL4
MMSERERERVGDAHTRALGRGRERRTARDGMSALDAGTWVCPGDAIARDGEAGAGTYVDHAGVVRASVCGAVATTTAAADGSAAAAAAADGGRSTTMVYAVRRRAGDPVVPRVDDVVYGRVTRVQEKAAHVEILAVNGRSPTGGGFMGVVRKQDVRAFEIDKVELDLCFRSGDVVRAKVLSLGDARSFYLTTASDELGVVQAVHSESGEVMLPISWTEFQDPVTGEVEDRKVARVDE